MVVEYCGGKSGVYQQINKMTPDKPCAASYQEACSFRSHVRPLALCEAHSRRRGSVGVPLAARG